MMSQMKYQIPRGILINNRPASDGTPMELRHFAGATCDGTIQYRHYAGAASDGTPVELRRYTGATRDGTPVEHRHFAGAASYGTPVEQRHYAGATRDGTIQHRNYAGAASDGTPVEHRHYAGATRDGTPHSSPMSQLVNRPMSDHPFLYLETSAEVYKKALELHDKGLIPIVKELCDKCVTEKRTRCSHIPL